MRIPAVLLSALLVAAPVLAEKSMVIKQKTGLERAYALAAVRTVSRQGNDIFVFSQDGRMLHHSQLQDLRAIAHENRDAYTITTDAENGTVSGGGTYAYGRQVQLTATADPHYRFKRWTDGVTDTTRIVCVVGDECFTAEFEPELLMLIDNRTASFANATERSYAAGITYTRNFTYTGLWCPLYIPINVAVDADFLADFDVAEIFAYARLYDTNGDGTLDADDAPYLVVQKLTSGDQISANYPYVIRPKTVGDKTLVSSDNILYPAEEDSIACSTTETRYVFRGNYSTKTIVSGDGNYFITTRGTIGGTASTTTLYAYRWYMNKYDSREGYGPDDDPAAVEARIIAIGEEVDEATALEAIEAADAQYSGTSVRKFFRDGHLYILRGEHLYDSTGRLVE